MSDISSEELAEMSAKYGGLSEIHWFYNHTVQLRFDRKKWTYYLLLDDGTFEAMSGVTSTTHRSVDKSEALIGWAKKMVMIKLRRLLIERCAGGDESAIIHVSTGELDAIIKESKRANEEELEKASDTGHIAHDWIESFIRATVKKQTDRCEELLAKFPVDPRAASCCVAALDWMSEHNVKWVCTERKVFSLKHRCAGTLDGLAYISSCSNPECCSEQFTDRLSVVDWKTSNALYVEHLLQTAFYQCAVEEEDKILVQDRWILRLDKETADFDPWHAPGREMYEQDITAFLKTLSMVKSVDVVEDRLDNIKGVKKAHRLEKEKKEREAAHKIKCPKADDYKGSRLSKCLPDDTQCEACRSKYLEKHPEKSI